MEVLGLLLDFFVAIGTLALAMFAFLQIRAGAQVRRVSELIEDAQLVRDQEGGTFLRDLRSAVLRWQRNPELQAAMNRMTRRYEDRIQEFRDEMRRELNSRLVKLREDLVAAFPEVDDGGTLVEGLADPKDPSDWLKLRRFDELAEGAEVRLRDGEWHPETIYDTPPGERNPYQEDPAPETRMLEILLARYRRLRQYEQLDELPRPIPEQIDRDIVTVQQIHGDIRARLVDWKQRSPEAALFGILIFVEALDPAGRVDEDEDPTQPSVDPLRMHLMGFPGIWNSISYLDVVFEPSALHNLDSNIRQEILRVVETCKQRLRAAVVGIKDEIVDNARPRIDATRLLDRAVRYGRRNIYHDG